MELSRTANGMQSPVSCSSILSGSLPVSFRGSPEGCFPENISILVGVFIVSASSTNPRGSSVVLWFCFICCQYWPTAPQQPFPSSKGPQLHLLERGLNLSFGRIQISSSVVPSSDALSWHLR